MADARYFLSNINSKSSCIDRLFGSGRTEFVSSEAGEDCLEAGDQRRGANHHHGGHQGGQRDNQG